MAEGNMTVQWNTDIDAAPKGGEDVLVSCWNLGRTGTRLMLGAQLFEPYERDPDDTDDDAQGGTWGEHEGKQGIWFWYLSDGEGQTDKTEIAAWAPAPESYLPPSQYARELREAVRHGPGSS